MVVKKILKYHISYLKYGFTSIKSGGEEKPQCIFCSHVFSITSMKPSKLKRHQESKHPSTIGKNIEYFESQVNLLHKSRIDETGLYQQNNKAGLKTSYEISRRIAIAKKPHTIGENLILPCCEDIIINMLGKSELKVLKYISLSDNTIKRRISEISTNILSKLILKIQNSLFNYFSIQLDETTDVTNLSQLCVYIRYVYNNTFEYDFLFCEPLNTRTTSVEIFKKIDKFFIKHNIKWENAVGVCTDGAPTMLGCHSGFQTLVKKIYGYNWNPLYDTSTGFNSENYAQKVKRCFGQCSHAVNSIRANALNSRLFSELCKENDSEFQSLLLYSHVR